MKHREHDFVRVKIDDLYIYSCYAAPSMTIPEYYNMLDRQTRNTKDHNPKVIAGNFNAWSMKWGSQKLKAWRARLLCRSYYCK